MTGDPLYLNAPEGSFVKQIVVTAPAHRISERYGSDPLIAASLMRATAAHLLEQADQIDPPLRRRLRDFLSDIRLWIGRLAQPNLGDWIGGLSVFATVYLFLVIAGVLS